MHPARSALVGVGPEPGKQEQPIQRLQAWMEGRSMADREREVVTALVEPARVTLGSTTV